MYRWFVVVVFWFQQQFFNPSTRARCPSFRIAKQACDRGLQILDFGIYRPFRTYIIWCAIKVLLQLRQFEAVAFRSWIFGIHGPSRTYAVSVPSLTIISSFRGRGLQILRFYISSTAQDLCGFIFKFCHNNCVYCLPSLPHNPCQTHDSFEMAH